MEAEIVIDGNVGQEVRVSEHAIHGLNVTFSVGVTPSYRRPDGSYQDLETIWFRVSCWRQLAENVRASVSKGDAVVVKGKLRLDRWVDRNGGQRQDYTINATCVGHHLGRGTASFERKRYRPEPETPTYLTDAEVARLAALEQQFADLPDPEEYIDADGVVHDLDPADMLEAPEAADTTDAGSTR